jgi:AraC-like DNA-binding protein
MSKLQPGNSIKNRDAEPLFAKANSILATYERAADCVVFILDTGGRLLTPLRNTGADSLCGYCRNGCGRDGGGRGSLQDGALPGNGQGEGFPCEDMHRKGIEESRKLGSSYIYLCPLGLVFWVSPLYSGGRYAGALMAGNVLGIEREEVLDRLRSRCSDGGALERLKSNLEAIPQRGYEEIKALAQMMLICAQQISSGAGIAGVEAGLSGRNGERQESAAQPALSAAQLPSAKFPETAQPSSKERLLIAALRRGDSSATHRILEEIFEDLKAIRPGDLQFFRCRAIELVVLLSRSCAAEKTSDPLLEENNLYLKKINESPSIEELQINLYRIIERMAGRIFSFHGLRHASALRRAERFIWKNYTRKVSLEEIASASGLSAPYFSTIFREEMGEHLSAHLNRLRVEKACIMLLETRTTLNEISESCGFEDQSWFSKIFKSYTGYSPGKYREQGGLNYSLDNYHAS